MWEEEAHYSQLQGLRCGSLECVWRMRPSELRHNFTLPYKGPLSGAQRLRIVSATFNGGQHASVVAGPTKALGMGGYTPVLWLLWNFVCFPNDSLSRLGGTHIKPQSSAEGHAAAGITFLAGRTLRSFYRWVKIA